MAPDVGRVRPRRVGVRHAQQHGGKDGVGHADSIHLLNPLRALRSVEEHCEVREHSGLYLLDIAQHVAVLTIPVSTEVHGLHHDGVGPELTSTRDELDALVVDPARVGILPLGVATRESLHHARSTVEERSGDGLAVDRDDEVEERVLRTLGLESRNGTVLSRERDGGIHVFGPDARPGLDHRNLVRERGEPTVDEAEARLCSHEREHRLHVVRQTTELDDLLVREAARAQGASERDRGGDVRRRCPAASSC